MNNQFQYILDKTGRKFVCPECNKRRLVRYIDIETNEYLPEIYGRCDRESKCSYHLNPFTNGYGTKEKKVKEYTPKPKASPQPVYYMPESVLNATLKSYDKNIFIQNLLKLCPATDIEKVISLYRLGTIGSGERAGAVTFPFIDKDCNIRTIQAKEFNEENHTTSTDFVHSIITRYYASNGEPSPGWLNDYVKNELKVSCLFGEHLLRKYPNNPVALVEAPKTAIIGSLYYGLPETHDALLWLAVFNKSSLNANKCKALQGRSVVLFPDLNAFHDWKTKTQELKAKLPGTNFIVSDILERNATKLERSSGLDLADYLIQFDCKLFKHKIQLNAPNEPTNATQCIKLIHEPKPGIITESEKGEKGELLTQHYFSHDLQYVPIGTPKKERRDIVDIKGTIYNYIPDLPELID